MDFLFKGMKEDASGCPFEETDILKCPFMRNINKPTNFSLSSFNFPLPVRGARGPIFEDGPNFDMTFNLFHGRNGVVPLSENSGIHCKRPEPEPTPQFNPLAGRTATISLSTFGLGGPFGFSHFDNKKNQKKNPNLSTKQDSKPQSILVFFNPIKFGITFTFGNLLAIGRYVGKFVKKSDRILPSPDAKYTNLYMKNLDQDVTEDNLREKFSEFGKIASLVIAKDDTGASRGYGFVNFESPDDARRAKEAMNGAQLG